MYQRIEFSGQPTGTTAVEVKFNPASDAAILLAFEHETGQSFDVLLNPEQAQKLARFLNQAYWS